MPYLKPNVPYEDNRTREDVLNFAFAALERNHFAFSSSSSTSKSWPGKGGRLEEKDDDDDDGERWRTNGGTTTTTTDTNNDTKRRAANIERSDGEEEAHWRIFATSDVHADMQANKDWVVRSCQNCNRPEPNTILIVAGDVATDVQKVIDALKLFKMRYQEVFYCVGNHELWSPGRGEMGDSIESLCPS